MKKQLLLLLTFCISLAAVAQVSSTDGTFSAAGTTNLGLRTNTTTRLTILGSGASAGFVGVNTAAPADWFHVNGNVRANQFNSVSGILNTIGTVNLSFRTNNTARMTILGATSGSRLAGFVGLNTITPDDWFHVNGNIRANQFNSVSGVLNTIGATNLSFNTNNTARMTINGTSGNVGIGTNNPSQIFHVHSNDYSGTRITTNATGSSNNDGVNFGYDDSYGAYVWNRENSPLLFSTYDTEKMRITADGNIGIGTTTPAYKLDVNGTLNATSILVNGQPISGGTSSWASDGVNTYIPSGNIGIGTTTPGAKLSFGQIESESGGLTWSDSYPLNYGIYRSAGPWSAPDYQQLQLSWDTGIILNPGNSYGKSYVDVQGNGLRVSSGNIGIGTLAPTEKLELMNGNLKLNSGSIYWGWPNQTIESHSPEAGSSVIRFRNSMDAGSGNPKGGFDFADHSGNSVMKITDYKVGIGTPTPAHKLHIVFPGSADYSNQAFQIESTDASLYNSINLKNDAGDLSQFGLTGSAYSWGLWKPNQTFMGNGGANGLLFAAYSSTGSITFGTGGTDASFERMRIDNLGNVSIGMPAPNPAYKLDVAGTINATSILVGGQPISGGSSSWANIGTDINFLTGNVGIGRTPTAGSKLDVDGTINSSSIFLNSNAGQGDPSFPTRSAGTKLVLNPSLATAAADYAFGTSANTLWSSVNTTSSSFKWFGGNTLAATLTGGGNLTLGGSGSIKARNVIPSSINLTTAGATTTLTSTSHYYQNSTVAQTIKLPVVTTLSNGHQFFIKNSSTQPVTVQTSAGMALQVMAANATLELTCINTAGGTGTPSWHWVYNTNTAGGSGGSSQWTTTGSDIAYNAGKVGIGTATPSEKLEIQEANDTPTVLKISNTNAGSNSMVSLKLRANNTEASFFVRNETPGGYGEFAPRRAGISNSGPIALITTSDASPINFAPNFNTKMTVMPDGKVGIGSTLPSTKLQIVGNGGTSVDMKVNGRIVSGDATNAGGIWVNEGTTMFMGQNSSSSLGFYNNGAWRMTVDQNGNVGIGTSSPNQKLTVNGTIYGKEVKVDLSVPGPDYVFEPSYDLKPLAEIETYIKENKHLPEVPSAKEMEANGVQLGEMNMLLLKKIEELTLHLIEMKKENEALKTRVEKIENKK